MTSQIAERGSFDWPIGRQSVCCHEQQTTPGASVTGRPRISVVMVTYNRCQLLKQALAHLLDQDVPASDYEVIVVNDGSTDETSRYLSRIHGKHALLAIHQANRGAAAARNAGIRRAGGELVLFLDDDLLCPPWLLRRHLEAHAQDPGDVVYGATLTSARSPATLAAQMTREASTQATARLDSGGARPGHEIALDPNCSISSDLLRSVGGFDESFGNSRETHEIAVRLREANVRFRYVGGAAVEEIYVKSADRLARDDAFAAGRSEIRLRRKHPRFRSESAIACVGEGNRLRVSLRRAAAGLPGADLLPALSLRACEALSSFPVARKTGVRLLRLRQAINFYRGAAAEAGSWTALLEEFGCTVPCLIYHHVGPVREGTYRELTIETAEFERHLLLLRRWGYQPITPSDWSRWRTHGGSLPSRPVMLTFDDAYAETADNAFPLLRKYAMSAAAFVVAGEVGGLNRWDVRLGSAPHRLMDAGQISYWSDHGIEFGAHTMTHSDLTRLDGAQAQDEVIRSRDLLSDLVRKPVRCFAYPYGYGDAQSERIVQSGFDLAFGTDEGLNSLATNPHALRRSMVQPGDGPFDLHCRLKLGYSLRRRWSGRLARLRPRIVEQGGRALGRAFPTLRSAAYLALEVNSMIRATPARQRERFESQFSARPDPWGYGQDREQARFKRELELLRTAESCTGSALEIGCAEGAFTEILAPHCKTLLAVDFSPTALARAASRVHRLTNVRLQSLDLRSAELPERLDLVVAIDVLDDLAAPWRMRSIRRKLADAVAPGGLLLIGNPRANAVIEDSWWGRAFVRGGSAIRDFFRGHPSLELVAEMRSADRVDSLFRRRPALEFDASRSGAAWTRSFYHQARILGSIFYERFLANQSRNCDLAHLTHEWDFSAPAEQSRYARVVAALEAARGPGGWGDVLEIGCSEGIFTEQIAGRFRRVEAMDLSPVACARAAARCAKQGNVVIRQGNLRDPLPENSYDVILAMCVWEYLQGHRQHADAARNIVAALRPGGLLVLNATLLPHAFEHSWWARRLVSGGAQIVRRLADEKNLTLHSEERAPDYLIAVFAKPALAPSSPASRAV